MEEQHTAVLAGFLSVYDEVILPSLSLMPNNCCLSEEVWGFLRLLKYEHRSVQISVIIYLLCCLRIVVNLSVCTYETSQYEALCGC